MKRCRLQVCLFSLVVASVCLTVPWSLVQATKRDKSRHGSGRVAEVRSAPRFALAVVKTITEVTSQLSNHRRGEMFTGNLATTTARLGCLLGVEGYGERPAHASAGFLGAPTIVARGHQRYEINSLIYTAPGGVTPQLLRLSFQGDLRQGTLRLRSELQQRPVGVPRQRDLFRLLSGGLTGCRFVETLTVDHRAGSGVLVQRQYNEEGAKALRQQFDNVFKPVSRTSHFGVEPQVVIEGSDDDLYELQNRAGALDPALLVPLTRIVRSAF